MLKVFDIITAYTYGQKHCVVAHSMADAERVYLDHYPGTTIESIHLHAEYVLVQPEATP
jgi:hypothetical protein